MAGPSPLFQSQTGSQALSDTLAAASAAAAEEGFNPKREARPSQTRQRQPKTQCLYIVSIPNGKPGPLRQLVGPKQASDEDSFNPKREARPSQTIIEDLRKSCLHVRFNPKREARPSQTRGQQLPAGAPR